MKTITENGIEYEVTGDYPKPPYTKQVKNKGEKPKEDIPVDPALMIEAEFRALVLKALGIRVKEA